MLQCVTEKYVIQRLIPSTYAIPPSLSPADWILAIPDVRPAAKYSSRGIAKLSTLICQVYLPLHTTHLAKGSPQSRSFYILQKKRIFSDLSKSNNFFADKLLYSLRFVFRDWTSFYGRPIQAPWRLEIWNPVMETNQSKSIKPCIPDHSRMMWCQVQKKYIYFGQGVFFLQPCQTYFPQEVCCPLRGNCATVSRLKVDSVKRGLSE